MTPTNLIRTVTAWLVRASLDAIKARIADSAAGPRALELSEYALDVRGRVHFDVLTDAQRCDLAAILAQPVRDDAAGHGEGAPW